MGINEGHRTKGTGREEGARQVSQWRNPLSHELGGLRVLTMWEEQDGGPAVLLSGWSVQKQCTDVLKARGM